MAACARHAMSAAAIALLVTHTAAAQTAQPPTSPAPAAPAIGATETGRVQTDLSQPEAGPSTQPATPTPPLPVLAPAVRIGQDLLAAGILPRLRYVDAFAANPTGGLKQGADNSGVVIFGADLDADKIAGIPGGIVHVSFAQLYGHELSTDNIGSRTKVQTYYYPYKQFELSELTYEQSLWGDRLNLLAGRANATGEFARDTFGCRFENVADCPLELTQLVGGFPGFPYVNWGGRARVRLNPDLYFKAGAYEINPDRNRNSGFDWDTTASTGFVLPVEVGYTSSFADDPTPRDLKLGMWYNSAAFNDPLLNTKHQSRITNPGAPLVHGGGREGAYALADQMVWRQDASTQRGIYLFAAAAAPFDNSETFVAQGVLGAIWNGALPSRPNDQIGVLADVLELSRKEHDYLNGLLLKAHSTSFIPTDGYVFELNYGYRVVPGVTIQPTLQYLVNPDDVSRTTAKFAPKDALVVGIKFSVNANQALSLPEQLSAGFRGGE
jgi:porin